MSRVLTDNIQTATGVTQTVKDKALFQGEVEGKKRGRVSRLSRGRKASSAREGGTRWAVDSARDSSLAEQERRFCGGPEAKSVRRFGANGRSIDSWQLRNDNKTYIEPIKVGILPLSASHFLPCSCD
jgi:hypothetical protein